MSLLATLQQLYSLIYRRKTAKVIAVSSLRRIEGWIESIPWSNGTYQTVIHPSATYHQVVTDSACVNVYPYSTDFVCHELFPVGTSVALNEWLRCIVLMQQDTAKRYCTVGPEEGVKMKAIVMCLTVMCPLCVFLLIGLKRSVS